MGGDRRILASSMWAGLSFAPTQERYDAFLARARPAFGSLIESVILHDVVTIPTDDYLTLTAIVDVLGDRAAIDLMESGVLRFLRVRGALAYVGGGGGVVEITFPFKGDGSDPSAIGADIPSAVQWALSGLKSKPDSQVGALAIKCSTEVALPSLKDQIATAAYSDFQQLPFASGKDPARLPGVTDRQVRILGGQEATSVNDDIGVVLALASANLELHLMAQTNSGDSSTATPIGHALRAREIRAGKPYEAFGELRHLANVPDVAESVLQKNLPLATLVTLRGSSAGASFREWFHENCATNPTDTARAYIDLLSAIPKTQTKTAKTLRFFVTTCLGLIPVVGGAIGAFASVLDSFVVDSVAERGNPKFFVEQLKQLHDAPPGGDA